MGSGEGRLLSRYAAADRIELQAGILGSFDRAADGLSDKGWDFDSTLLDVEDDGAARWQLGLWCGDRSIRSLIRLPC